MKTKIAILIVLILTLTQACTARVPSDAGSQQEEPAIPPVIVGTALAEESQSGGPEVSTAVAVESSQLQDITPVVIEPSEGNIIPESGLTMDDNGKSFNMNVGDSVLLNLGTDDYDWQVTIDNQDVLRMKMGVMVIKGAQGIYDAMTPGTAILSASGDPLCRQSRPACAMPSIGFSVTIVVK